MLGECNMLDVPSDIRQPVGEYCTHCMELTPDGVAPMVEVIVPLFYQPHSTGTCDFAVVSDGRVVVRDYKHGAGVLVTSQENTQLAIYAMSLIRDLEDVYDFSPDTVVDLAVFQPRHHEGSEQSPWVLSMADFEAFCAEIVARAKEAQAGVDAVKGATMDHFNDVACSTILDVAPMTKFAPSEGDGGACRWCSAKAFCEVRLAAITEGIPNCNAKAMLASMPDLSKEEKKLSVEDRLLARIGVEEDPHAPLDDEFLVSVFAAAKGITSFLADVSEYLETRALAGEDIEGTKLVMGREGNRAWHNEEAAETFLKGQKLKLEDRCKITLKSPTQIEKILKEKLDKTARTRSRFEELVTRSAAREVLAMAGDKREAVRSAVNMMPCEEEDFEI